MACWERVAKNRSRAFAGKGSELVVVRVLELVLDQTLSAVKAFYLGYRRECSDDFVLAPGLAQYWGPRRVWEEVSRGSCLTATLEFLDILLHGFETARSGWASTSRLPLRRGTLCFDGGCSLFCERCPRTRGRAAQQPAFRAKRRPGSKRGGRRPSTSWI